MHDPGVVHKNMDSGRGRVREMHLYLIHSASQTNNMVIKASKATYHFIKLKNWNVGESHKEPKVKGKIKGKGYFMQSRTTPAINCSNITIKIDCFSLF